MKCSFCLKEINKGSGKMYVKKDGKVFYFCSNKCEKNTIKLGRKSRDTKWVTKKPENKQAQKKKE